MADYITGKTRKQLKNLEANHEAYNRVLKNREEEINLKQWTPKKDADSLIGTKPGFKNLQKVKNANSLNARIGELFLDKLSNSLALSVVDAVQLDEGKEDVKVALHQGVASMFKNIFASEKVDLKNLTLDAAPHTASYLANLMELAKTQAEVEKFEKKEDKDAEDTLNSAILAYETQLSTVVAEKIKLMLKNEKEINARRKADELYAKENAISPEKYMKKKAKSYCSMFQDIMQAHIEGELKSGKQESELNKNHLLAESIVSYAILETLHTSKLATRADLSYVE